MSDRNLVFPEHDRVRLLRNTWNSIISQGLWSVANTHLYDLLPSASTLELRHMQASVYVMLGSALRWSGKLAEAEQYLQKALDLVPHGTTVYADALIELAVVYRYQDRGTSAEAAVRSAVSQYDQLNDEISVQRGGLELAQIAIEQKQPERALSQMPTLTSSARLEAIKAEAYLLFEQTDTACEHAEYALLLAKGQPAAYFRAQALLGQIQHARGDCEAARSLLADAGQNLRHIQDELGWARSASALATALVDIGASHESIDIIAGAIVSQETSGDVAGLKHSVQTQMQVYAALTEQMLQAGNASAAATWGNMLAQAHRRWETLRH